MGGLLSWSKEKFGAVTHELEQIRKRLQELEAQPLSTDRGELEITQAEIGRTRGNDVALKILYFLVKGRRSKREIFSPQSYCTSKEKPH
jgi:hypothetical protein